MAKADQKQARSQAIQFGSDAQRRGEQNIFGGGAFGSGGLQSEFTGATQRRDTSFGAAQQGYREAQDTGGYDPTSLQKVRANTDVLAGTGGYDQGQLGQVRGNLQSRFDSGGYDPGQLGYLRGVGSSFVDSGGYGDVSGIRSGYQNFADTGGISDSEADAFRRRATSSVESTYSTLANEAERRRNLTGGLGTGGDISQLARQLSEQSAQANLNAEVDLASQRRQGKLSGLQGLQGLEGDVASGRRSALTGLQALESGVSAGSRDITSQQGGLETAAASGIRAGVGAQAGLESSVASGRLAGSAGLASLYNQSTGEVSDIGNQILKQIGLEQAGQQTKLDVLSKLANSPGIFDNILRGLNAASGFVMPKIGKGGGGATGGAD